MIDLDAFESYLQTKVKEGQEGRVKSAMAYSLVNGGKRMRPQLLFATLQLYGFDPTIGFPCASAIEKIHTYSLIHDDLPAMDDDDMRRGQPSCHVQFDEATAILAGDGLLTRAFDVVLETNVDAEKKVGLVSALSKYSGVDGMIYGQELDLKAESAKNLTLDDVFSIDTYKTAKLLTLPFVCAAIIAGKEEDIPTWQKIGYALGIQFQIQDDLLDQTQSSQALGKSTSDNENHKQTFVSLMGLEAAKKKVLSYQTQIETMLSSFEGDLSYLQTLIDFMTKRTY